MQNCEKWVRQTGRDRRYQVARRRQFWLRL